MALLLFLKNLELTYYKKKYALKGFISLSGRLFDTVSVSLGNLILTGRVFGFGH
jgi:hypothetical protein